jgi:signal transduction histidine kinase
MKISFKPIQTHYPITQKVKMINLKASLFNHQRYDRATQQALLELGIGSLKPWLSLALAVLLLACCYGMLNKTLAIMWLILVISVAGFGHWYCRKWDVLLRSKLSIADLKKAESWGIVYGSLVAIVWGSTSQFMVLDHVNNLLITMIYLGVCAGAAALSVLGMAHMAIAAVIGFSLFVEPLQKIFPSFWIGFTVILVLYHLVILLSTWQRHQIVANNIELTQEQNRLIQYQLQETERANQANQDKSSFLAAASHDLRQPVHAIMLLAHTLLMKPLNAEVRALTDQMLLASKTLSYQFNTLMELSRLECGKYQLSLQPLKINDFLRDKLQSFRDVALQKNILIQLDIDKRLPDHILTDSGLLSRIVDNLLDNAIKFSQENQIISISFKRRKERLRLAVRDHGIGIAQVEHNNIFQPYVQLNNPVRDRSLGIGLGLSIVKEAALLLQAELSVYSRQGQGSCFVISLPLSALKQQYSGIMHNTQTRIISPEETAWLQGKNLLIIEDDIMVANALSNWAETLGMVVQHHLDPRKVSLKSSVDFVICDIRLPGEQDGIYWLSEWLAEWPSTGGVLISGESDESVQERAEDEGLILLAKPVDPNMLLHTLISLKREGL